MTATPTVPDAEVRRRAGSLLAAGRVESWEAALEMAADELALEQAERAAAEERARAFSDSFQALTSCGACGAPAIGSRSGFCDRCAAVGRVLEAEAFAECSKSETLQAVSRRRRRARRAAAALVAVMPQMGHKYHGRLCIAAAQRASDE